MNLEELGRRVHTSSRHALFGEGEEARRTYRQLLATAHPDRWGGSTQATEVFQALQKLWETDETHRGRRHTYHLHGESLKSDIAQQRRCTWDEDGTTRDGMVKIARTTRSNDLLEAETTNLRVLATGEPEWLPYFPEHVEDLEEERRRGITFTLPKKNWTLAEVAARRPGGLDPRDAAWMWRRLLVALGAAARTDLVHGAVWPENIVIIPEDHGLVLINWHLAVPIGETVPAVVRSHRDETPPEILAQEAVGPATDIYMAAKTMKLLMGPKIPPQIDAFVQGCTLSVPSRPQDPWELLGELDELLERLYGPKKFRAFQP